MSYFYPPLLDLKIFLWHNKQVKTFFIKNISFKSAEKYATKYFQRTLFEIAYF